MRYEQWTRLRLSLIAAYTGSPVSKGPDKADTTFLSAWLIHDGQAHIETYGVKLEAARGHWLIVPAGERLQTFSEDIHLTSLAIYAHWPDGQQLFSEGLPCRLNQSDHPRMKTIAKRLCRIRERWLPGLDFDAFRSDLPLAGYLELEKHLPDFVSELSKALDSIHVPYWNPPPLDPRVETALDVIDAHPFADPFDLKTIASRCGLSVPHLDRLFRQQIGHSPRAHYDRCRLARARHLLSSRERQVKAVAYTLGFRDAGHFTRWFKRVAGYLPSEESTRAPGTPHKRRKTSK